MKKYFLPMAILFIAILGCKKTTSTATADSVTIDAKIINTGSKASDGCDWMIEIDSVKHELWHPDNLSASYQVDKLPVRLTYHKGRTDWSCGQAFVATPDPNALNTVFIDNISRR